MEQPLNIGSSFIVLSLSICHFYDEHEYKTVSLAALLSVQSYFIILQTITCWFYSRRDRIQPSDTNPR